MSAARRFLRRAATKPRTSVSPVTTKHSFDANYISGRTGSGITASLEDRVTGDLLLLERAASVPRRRFGGETAKANAVESGAVLFERHGVRFGPGEHFPSLLAGGHQARLRFLRIRYRGDL